MTQQEALEILKLGHNIYLTGAAGTGKTHTLNAYLEHLKRHRVVVGITASTGIAATHLGGMTIQSWSGMGNLETVYKEDLEHLQQKLYLKLRYLGAKVLLIDEISMLHAYQLDIINRLCKTFKSNALPFGGMQVILCGDFFQLPPVNKYRERSYFAFESKAWEEANLRICYLDKAYRHADKDFITLLNAVRANHVTDAELSILVRALGQEIPSYIVPTRLYPHNVDVDAINAQELSSIDEKEHTYMMHGKGPGALVEGLTKGCLAPEKLVLKKKAQVMFVKNNPRMGYVNGTRGKIVDFDHEGFPIVELVTKRRIAVRPEKWSIIENNIPKAHIQQLPLRLAWAITIHKSQGMTLDAAEIDLSKSFVHGMGYVALSRVRSLKGMRLLGVNEMALQVDPDILEVDKELRTESAKAVEELKSQSWWTRFWKKRQFMTDLTSKY